MSGWIVAIAFYVLGFIVFRLLGGVSSAADAIQEWGRAYSRTRGRLSSSS
jgi:hypothetical protein